MAAVKRGFTLIEALVTTALLALLALSAFPFLQQYQKQLNLEEAALALQNCFISASDYARAPSAGATSYQAVLRPADNKCVVQRVGTTAEDIDETDFEGVAFTNTANINVDSFALIVDTTVLHDVSYQTVVAGATGQAFGTGSVTWVIKPAGQASPQKNITVNLAHGIVTIAP